MKALARALISRIVTEYRINWIYAADRPSSLALQPGEAVMPVDAGARTALADSSTPKMRNSLSYANAGLAGLVLVREDVPLCVAHFATPAQYDRTGTWPLREGEMALMDIATEEATRGQGLAPRMIAAATRHFISHDTRRLIAFIWWSNTPSVRAFTKAGWRRVGFSLEWQIGKASQSLHFAL